MEEFQQIKNELELVKEEMKALKNLIKMEELVQKEDIEDEPLVKKDIQMRRLQSQAVAVPFQRFRSSRIPQEQQDLREVDDVDMGYLERLREQQRLDRMERMMMRDALVKDFERRRIVNEGRI